MTKIIKVIETTTRRGAGVEGNPSRVVTQYFSKSGKLLAENDPYLEAHKDDE